MQPPLDVELIAVTKRYGATAAVEDISLRIPRGTYCCLLGPSGCGKTTLLRILAGFEVPDMGQVLLNGQDVTHLPPNKRRMGMVFQAYSLFPNMDVHNNVAFGLRMRGKDRGDRLRRPDELLELGGLSQAASRYPHQLSGGQQQRVALARALVYEPAIILLDEPLSNLDAKLREEARAWLRQLIVSLGLRPRLTHRPHELSGGQQQRVAIARALATRPDLVFADEPTGNLDTHSTREILEIFERLSDEGRTIILITHEHEVAAHADRIIELSDGHIVSDATSALEASP